MLSPTILVLVLRVLINCRQCFKLHYHNTLFRQQFHNALTTGRQQVQQDAQHRHTHLLEQVDGHGVAAVLSADAQLDVGARGAAALHSQLDQLAHTNRVHGLEGVEGQQAILGVELQELGLRVVAADAEGLRENSGGG